MKPDLYDWTNYWNAALKRGQGELPPAILRLIEAARDEDAVEFAAEARTLPQLELTVAHMIFDRVEELHRRDRSLEPVADAIAALVETLEHEEARRNQA